MDYLRALLSLDYGAFESVNQLAGRDPLADGWVKLISENPLLKGAAMMARFWFLWAGARDKDARFRNGLLAVLVAAISALFLGRLLALLLPFRLRPMHSEAVVYQRPFGLPAGFFDGWSSFPSDHALLHFSLAGGFFLLHRGLGWIALAHAVLVVSLPRIYLGYHFPSDILIGGLVGAGVAAILVPAVGNRLSEHDVAGRAERHPEVFYAGLFLVTFLLATNFDSLRAIANAVTATLHGLI